MTVNQVRAFVFIEGDDGPLLLLTRRKFPPYTGKLSLPGGFVKSGMTPAEAIRYKLERETSLKVEDDQLHSFKVKSTKFGDPRGDFLCEYFLTVLPKQSLELNEEESKEKSEFYYLDEIEELGFDHGPFYVNCLVRCGGSFPCCLFHLFVFLYRNSLDLRILIFRKKLFFTVGHSTLGIMDIWHVLNCVQIKI